MHKKRQKPKNLKAALSNLFSYCKKEAGIILFALIMAALGAVLTIAGPNQISKITDYIYNGLTGGFPPKQSRKTSRNRSSPDRSTSWTICRREPIRQVLIFRILT